MRVKTGQVLIEGQKCDWGSVDRSLMQENWKEETKLGRSYAGFINECIHKIKYFLSP